jgi:hypothetical protein
VDASAYEVILFYYACYVILVKAGLIGVLLLIRIRLLSKFD